MLFNDVIWEFHIICFDHVSPHPSTPPRPTKLHVFLFSARPPPLPFKLIQPVLGVGLALECYWFIKITPLKKMGLFSPTSNQMISFLVRSRLETHLLYSTLRFCLAWVCASLVHVSSYVPLSCCVQNTLSHWSLPPPLTVFYSCCWESSWPLREEVCYKNVPLRAEHFGVSCFLHLDQFWVSVNWHILASFFARV